MSNESINIGPRQKAALIILNRGGIKIQQKKILILQDSFASLLRRINDILEDTKTKSPELYHPEIKAEKCLKTTKKIIEMFENGREIRLKKLKESNARVSEKGLKVGKKTHLKTGESTEEKTNKIMDILEYIREILTEAVRGRPQQAEKIKETIIKALSTLDNLKVIKVMQRQTEKIRKDGLRTLEDIVLRVYSGTLDATEPEAEEIEDLFEPEEYPSSEKNGDPKELKF